MGKGGHFILRVALSTLSLSVYRSLSRCIALYLSISLSLYLSSLWLAGSLLFLFPFLSPLYSSRHPPPLSLSPIVQAAVLDAFSDAAIAALNMTEIEILESKRVQN